MQNKQNKRKKIQSDQDDCIGNKYNNTDESTTTTTTTTTSTTTNTATTTIVDSVGNINQEKHLSINKTGTDLNLSPLPLLSTTKSTTSTLTNSIIGMRKSVSSPLGSRILTLSELESLAQQADDSALERRARQQYLRTNTLLKSRLEALPILIGAIRRLMLTEKKTIYPLETIARKLSKTLDTAIEEVVHRFKLLVKISKESESKFIEIKKKDHVLPMRVVLTKEENKGYNDYVRPKLLQKIHEELQKCQEIEEKIMTTSF